MTDRLHFIDLLVLKMELDELSEAELESRVAELSAEQRIQLAELVARMEAERLRAEREPPSIPLLGGVEKFLLWYVSNHYQLHTRNCAIQAYYRYYHALSLRQTRNLRKLIDDDGAYDSLQGSFTRAIKSLKAKGLIETYKVKPSLWFADRGRGPEPATKKDQRYYLGELEVGYGGDERPVRIFNHRCCIRNRLVYRLTLEGLLVATAMKEPGALKGPYDQDRLLRLKAYGFSDSAIRSVMSEREA